MMEPEGQVRGVVLVEGSSLSGIVLELTGPEVRSTSTDAAGRYVFEGVPPGAYVVTVRSTSEDVLFPATSRTAVVSGARTATVDFLGNYIRTASIEGSVTAGSRGLVGVAVMLEGVQSDTRITGQGGGFIFSGLRAGRYEVRISEFPASVSFPSVRTDVELSTGQPFLVTFVGQAKLTARVMIHSIEHRLPDGSLELADPQNLHGDLEVTLSVDQGEDTLEAVELLLGDEVVGGQSFALGRMAPEVGVGQGAGLQASAPLSVRLLIDTAASDRATGAVRFPNGQYALSARLATAEGGPLASAASVQVRLRNTDTITGEMTPARGPVTGTDGEPWIGGDLTVRVIPILYDLSRAVESVTLALRRSGGGQLRTLQGEVGSSPLVMPARGEPGSGNLAGYQTPAGATDELSVVSARYEGGDPVPGAPVVLARQLRIDNAAPPNPVFALPIQGAEATCCLGNWVGSGFDFSSAVDGAPDAGAGGASVSIHVGTAALSDDELAEGPAVEVGADLSPTTDNVSLRAVAVASDTLGNAIVVPLSTSDGNPASGPQGALFGVDLAPPILEFDPTSVGDQARNPPPGSAWVLAAGDPLSGFGPLPARTSVRVRSPALSGRPEQCLFPESGDCRPAPDGLVRGVPAGVEGYIILESRVLDRAGNISAEIRGSVVVDETAPVLGPLSVPGALRPNEPAQFRVRATDNLDLDRGWISFEYEDGGAGGREVVAMVSPRSLGVPFDEVLTTDGSLAQTVLPVVGLERVVRADGLAAPAGSVLRLAAARAVVTDAAGNRTIRTEPLPGAAGLSARSFSVSERGPVSGVADFSLEAASDRVCAGTCGTDVPASIRLAAAARGLGEAFEQPFQRVHFYLVGEGESEWIATSSRATRTDGDGPLGREWSWSAEWTPAPTMPPGSVVLYAVGVDGDGNALRSLDLTSLYVEAAGR